MLRQAETLTFQSFRATPQWKQIVLCFSPLTKYFMYWRVFREYVCFCNKLEFVYKVPQLYKRIQHLLELECFDGQAGYMEKDCIPTVILPN
jgi:hypothetical protein